MSMTGASVVTPRAHRRVNVAAAFALLILWLAHTVTLVLWLVRDTRPPYYDMAGHAIFTLRTAQLPFFTDFAAAWEGLLGIGPYPPLIYLLGSLFVEPFGRSIDSLTLVNAVFLAILLLSTFGIGRRVADQPVALLAAFLVSFYPTLYGLTRSLLLDFPLVSMTALCVWLLLRTDGFRARGASALFGVAVGLGLLTKWTLLTFIAGPSLVVALNVVARREAIGRRLLNLVIAILFCLLVAAPWYMAMREELVAFLGLGFQYAQVEGDPAIGSSTAWLYYLRNLIQHQILLPFTLLFFGATLVLLKRRGVTFHTLVLGSWVLVPYILFTLLLNKNARYTLPYLPAIALISAWGLRELRSRRLRLLLLGTVGAYAFVQFVGLTWGIRTPDGYGTAPPLVVHAGQTPLPLYSEFIHLVTPASRETWQIDTILSRVSQEQEARTGGDPPRVVILADAPYFEINTFVYHTLAHQMSVEFTPVTGISYSGDARQEIFGSDFVVTRSGFLGRAAMVHEGLDLREELRDPSSFLGRRARLIEEFPLPDGTVAMLYAIS